MVLEIPRERFRGTSGGQSRNLLVVLVGVLVSYLLAPLLMFLIAEVLHHKNRHLEMIVYETVPKVAATALAVYFGIVLGFVGITAWKAEC